MRHSFTILLTMCILMVVGAALSTRLDIASEPRPEQGKTLTISYSWPGSAAKVIEQNVTSRIEAIASSVKGVEKVSSVSEFSSGRVTVELKKEADVSAVKFEIASLLRQTRGKLPKGVSYPEITGGEVDTGIHEDDGIKLMLTYQVNAGMPDDQIRRIVSHEVKPLIERAEGVHHVDVTGGSGQYMEISYDARELANYGIYGADIAATVRSYAGSEDIVGSVYMDEGRLVVPLLLRTSGVNLELEKMPVKTVDGKIIYLNNLASCEFRQTKPDSYYRVNGMNTIYLNVFAEKDVNMVSLAREVKRLAKCPPMVFTLTYDRADEQMKEFRTLVLRSSMTLAILLLFVWLSGGRRWKYLAIIACTLAANILVAVIVYWAMGIRLHPLSMAGITVSLGIIIDSSIVMVDHYSYYRDRKAFLGILAAMLTTIGSLVVVFWLPDYLRHDLRDFSVIVMINLAVAMAVALLFAPALVDRLHYSSRAVGTVRSIRRKVALTRVYRKYVGAAQGRFGRWILLALFAGAFAGSLKMFSDCLDTNTFGPKEEEKKLNIQAQMPLGGSVQELNEKVKIVEAFLSGFNQIRRFETSIDRWGAKIVVEFKEEAQHTGFPYKLESKVIGKVISIGGADWSTYGVSDRGFSNSLNLQYRQNSVEIAGYDYDRLYRYAEDMCIQLRKNPRITDLAIETPEHEQQEDELYMEYDRRMLAVDSISARDIHSSVQSILSEVDAGDISLKGHGRSAPMKTHTVVRPSDTEDFDLWHLENAFIRVNGEDVRTSDFMKIGRREAKNCIPRENQEYVLRVAFNILGSYTYQSRCMKQVTDRFNSIFPAGFRCLNDTWGAYDDDGTQYWLVGLIAVIIFWICAILFESLYQSLVVVLLIPTSFIGLFLTYSVTGIPFGTGGFAAMVLLCGLTVNAGIYIICEYRNCGNYLRAFNHKIIPILLTALSTVLGMIPFLIDGPDDQPFWFSLAVGTIGGLLFSLLPLVLFMPVMLRKKYRQA